MFRGILIVFAFSISSLADMSHQVKRLYPALSVMAGLGCKSVMRADTAVSTFCDKLILSGMFAAGDEIADALVEHELANSTAAAQIASASTLLVTGFDYAHNPESI